MLAPYTLQESDIYHGFHELMVRDSGGEDFVVPFDDVSSKVELLTVTIIGETDTPAYGLTDQARVCREDAVRFIGPDGWLMLVQMPKITASAFVLSGGRYGNIGSHDALPNLTASISEDVTALVGDREALQLSARFDALPEELHAMRNEELAKLEVRHASLSSRLNVLPDELAKLKAELHAEVQSELASRDQEISWLGELRANLTSDLRSMASEVRTTGQQVEIMAEQQAAKQASSPRRLSPRGSIIAEPVYAGIEPLGAAPQVTTAAAGAGAIEASQQYRRPSAESLAATGAGAIEASFAAENGAGTSRSLATKLAAMASERGDGQDSRESAVANLYKWFASASATKAGDMAAAEPRGRPKTKPSAAAPTRELIRAAAQELVNAKNSDERVQGDDPFRVKFGSSMADVEDVHVSGGLDGTAAPDRRRSE